MASKPRARPGKHSPEGLEQSSATGGNALAIIIDQNEFQVSLIKGVTPAGKVVTARYYDDGTATDIMPMQVVLSDLSGNAVAPATGSSTGAILAQQNYDATGTGTGYTTGDLLNRTLAENPTTSAITTYWFNLTQGTLLGTAPTAGTYKEQSQNVVVTSIPTQTYGGKTGTVSTTGANSTSAYTAGYVVGGLLTFASILGTAMSGILQSAKLSLKTVHTEAFKLYIFNANPTASTFTDHAAPAIAASDISSLIDVIPFSSPDSGLGTHTLYAFDGIGKALNAGTTSLYGVLITTGTPTFTSTSDIVSVTLNVLQD